MRVLYEIAEDIMRINKGTWVVLIIIGVLILAYVGSQMEKKDDGVLVESVVKDENDIFQDEKVEPAKIVVHIAGAVVNSGVYELDEGKRLWDAIIIAGGALENADIDKINMALKLEDGMKYYIPAADEKAETDNDIETEESNGLININTAGIYELSQLPNIGEVTAKSIMQYRENHGKYKKKADIKNVSGIGNKTYDAIASLITVD